MTNETKEIDEIKRDKKNQQEPTGANRRHKERKVEAGAGRMVSGE